jgi:hypothetical protein
MKKPRTQDRKIPHGAPDAVEVVNEIAIAIGGRLRNVKSSWQDGSTRVRELRTEYLGHRIEIVADRQSVMVDIEARFGRFTLVNINPWKKGWPPACVVNAEGSDYEIYTYGNKLSQDQLELVETGTLARLLASLQLHPEEMMDVSQRLVRFDLKNPSVDRVLMAIQAVIRLMPHESTKSFQPYDDLPNKLQLLVALMSKWSISDDEERSEKISRAARSTRIRLVETVLPLIPEINQYLDTFQTEPLSPEACELGSLVEAALEAQISLNAGSDNTSKTKTAL